MIKRLILILNGKGGVGKSFFAVNFVQYLKDKNIPHTACDCDNENSTLKRFHGESVEFMDLACPRALDFMFRAFEKTNLVVVDCRAASTEVFFDYFDAIELRESLPMLSVALTLVMPVNHEADSVDQLQRIVNKMGNVCGYVVLRNEVHDDTFAVYEQSVVRKRLKKELGVKEITMKKLQPWLVEELSLKNLPITEAVKDGSFYLLDRQRLQTWQRKIYTEIESAAELLLPSKVMSDTPKETKPDFDEEFLQALAQWREQHKIRDDDSVLFLVELFRIHQKHWDELRRREFPPLQEFHADVASLAKTVKKLPNEYVSVTAAVLAVIAGLLGGYLIGKAW